MKFVVEWKGNTYDCEWSDDTNFEDLDKIAGVSGFIFDDSGKFCIVKIKSKDNWTLPGGSKEEYDKTFEYNFIREVDEEADLEIKNIKRIGYVKSTLRGTKETNYSGRFVAKVKKVKPQTIDPAENEINDRKFIAPEQFNEYAHWGENGDFQVKKSLEALNKLTQNFK